MIKLPKAHAIYRGRTSDTVIIGEERAFTEQEAAEVIRRAEAYEGLVGLLRYFYELPSNGLGNYEQHQAALERAEQILSGEPK